MRRSKRLFWRGGLNCGKTISGDFFNFKVVIKKLNLFLGLIYDENMNTPREKISLASAYFLLLFAGTIGLHQFFLRNWKRGVALLATTGLSQLCFFDLFNTGAVHKLIICFRSF